MTDPVALCAHGEAAWQALAYRSLDAGWADDGVLARATGQVPHRYLLGAVTLTPDAAVPAGVPGIVCDSFACLRLPGREPEPAGHWMLREPGAVPVTPRPSGLVIRQVLDEDELVWFEQLAFLAAGGELPGRAGELHPAGSWRLPGLSLWLAELDGQGVGTALSVATARVNNLGAVAVMPAYRGLGIGAALTAAALGAATGVPATLSATASGRGVYARLGFTTVGRPLHHHPA